MKKTQTIANAFLGFLMVLGLTVLPSSNVFAGNPLQATIKEVQVVQVLGRQFEDRKDFVAGKDTVVRVLMSAAALANPATQKVEIARDGAAVTTLDAAADFADPAALLFTCPTRSACGDWVAGTYTFNVKIDGATQTVDGLQFKERKALRILAVPVTANYEGHVQSVTGSWKQAGNFLKQTFPVAPANFNWQNGNELDASGYDINTPEGRKQLWKDLVNLQPKECAENPAGSNCFDLIMGFIPAAPTTVSGGKLLGYTFGQHTGISVEHPGVASTVAHEVAHGYGLGDEYNKGQFNCEVNPVPPTFSGKKFREDLSPYSCDNSTEQPFPGASATLIPASFMPYEVGGRGLLPDMASFMGTGYQQTQAWITPRGFAHLFEQLDPARTTGVAPSIKVAKFLAPQRFLYASGFIPKNTSDKVELDPWYAFTDDTPAKPVKGDYSLEALDASGKVLASNSFKLEFSVPDQPADLDKAPFEVVVPFPDGTAKFVVKKGATVLGERIVSKNAPTVTLLTPKANESVDGSYSITWEGKDADNDKLYYDVEYSPDGKEESYFFLVGGLAAAKHTENFKDLPGGDKATLRLTVSDGILTGEAVSAPFKVALKPPEAFIEKPADKATFKAGQEIPFVGSAYDLQMEDWLAGDDQLVWTSDKAGEIGKGEMIYVDKLAPGDHTITLTAIDTNGLKSSKSIKITIGAAAPGAAAPASGGGLCGAIALAFVPLGMVFVVRRKK